MANRYYSNTAAQTTLSGSISAGATSIQVAAVTGFPTSYPYTLALDYGAAAEELVSVTTASGTTLTVTRAYGGTSAQSHSLGAVVRHVWDAQDATDFRTHENASAAVHGLTGSVVGTSDTQTLSNKTLTAPTVNGGAFSGTFTGSPTFSGAPVFTGGPVVNTLPAVFHRTAASDAAAQVRLDADSQPRLAVSADGKLTWGSGSAAGDVVLYRETTNTLTTEDTFRVLRAAGGDNAVSIRVAGDTNSRLLLFANGQMWFGDGSAGVDTNLYRNAASQLKTDDAFVAAVTTATSGITAASGFSVTSFDARETCGVLTLNIVLTRTGATITANATGNITDAQCGTLDAAYRPAGSVDYIASFDKSGIADGILSVTPGTGLCTLKTLSPGATIASGDEVRFTLTFVK